MGIWMSTAAEENHHAGPAVNYHHNNNHQNQQQQHQQQHQQVGAANANSGGGGGSGVQHQHHHHSGHSGSHSGAMLTRRPSRDRSGGAAGKRGEATRAADWAWENSHWTKLRANKERDRDVPKCRCVAFGLFLGCWGFAVWMGWIDRLTG